MIAEVPVQNQNDPDTAVQRDEGSRTTASLEEDWLDHSGPGSDTEEEPAPESKTDAPQEVTSRMELNDRNESGDRKVADESAEGEEATTSVIRVGRETSILPSTSVFEIAQPAKATKSKQRQTIAGVQIYARNGAEVNRLVTRSLEDMQR
jgi:hypothetical protein